MKLFAAIACLFSLIVLGLIMVYYDIPLKTMATNVGFVAAIITGAGIIFTKMIKPAYVWFRDGGNAIVKLVNEAAKLIEVHRHVDIRKLDENVTASLKELRPNGGSSLRDAINRIEDRVVSTDQVTFALRQDSPSGFFICDKHGSNRDVNRTYCRWLGVGANELTGHGWRNFVVKNEQSVSAELDWTAAFNQGREVEFVLSMKTSEGEPLMVDVKAHPIRNRVGEVIEFVGIVSKIG